MAGEAAPAAAQVPLPALELGVFHGPVLPRLKIGHCQQVAVGLAAFVLACRGEGDERAAGPPPVLVNVCRVWHRGQERADGRQFPGLPGRPLVPAHPAPALACCRHRSARVRSARIRVALVPEVPSPNTATCQRSLSLNRCAAATPSCRRSNSSSSSRRLFRRRGSISAARRRWRSRACSRPAQAAGATVSATRLVLAG